ncbi:MAG: hypothetical protein GC159_06205 [Phycisphaera sp.]|nr:hypothetical protein [Phycisphaera sp.]
MNKRYNVTGRAWVGVFGAALAVVLLAAPVRAATDDDTDRGSTSDRQRDEYKLAERAGRSAGAAVMRLGAMAQRDRAWSQLRNTQSTLLHQLEADPAYAQASRDMTEARDAYEATRGAAIGRLSDNDAYRDTLIKAAEVDARIDAAHADPQVDPGYVERLARLRLAIGSRLGELESAAIDADPQVAATGAAYHASRDRYLAIEHGLREQLHTNDAVASALDRAYEADDALYAARAEAAAARAEYRTAARKFLLDRAYSPYGYGTYGYSPRGYVAYPTSCYSGGGFLSGLSDLFSGCGYGGHRGGVTISAFGGPLLKAN